MIIQQMVNVSDIEFSVYSNLSILIYFYYQIQYNKLQGTKGIIFLNTS